MAKHAAFLLLALMLLAPAGCRRGPSPAVRQRQTELATFRAAREHVIIGNYQLGVTELQTFLVTYPNSEFASRAQFFIAKAHLGLGDRAEARKQYGACIQQYPGTDEAHKSRFKIAILDMAEGNNAAAAATFHSMADNPDGPLAAEASVMADYLDALASGGPIGKPAPDASVHGADEIPAPQPDGP